MSRSETDLVTSVPVIADNRVLFWSSLAKIHRGKWRRELYPAFSTLDPSLKTCAQLTRAHHEHPRALPGQTFEMSDPHTGEKVKYKWQWQRMNSTQQFGLYPKPDVRLTQAAPEPSDTRSLVDKITQRLYVRAPLGRVGISSDTLRVAAEHFQRLHPSCVGYNADAIARRKTATAAVAAVSFDFDFSPIWLVLA